MPRSRIVAGALAAVVIAACVTRREARLRAIPATATTGQVEALVRRAVALDAAQDAAADSLYAPDALVVANARVRLAAPRFAGIGSRGRTTVAAASVTLHGRFAWALVDYRWINIEQRQAEAGRATFVLEERAGAWTIIHAHSSQLLPWDR
ncbi:MAG: nuclear transport factor 2 family protein [Gemmatimonadales bacterium]